MLKRRAMRHSYLDFKEIVKPAVPCYPNIRRYSSSRSHAAFNNGNGCCMDFWRCNDNFHMSRYREIANCMLFLDARPDGRSFFNGWWRSLMKSLFFESSMTMMAISGDRYTLVYTILVRAVGLRRKACMVGPLFLTEYMDLARSALSTSLVLMLLYTRYQLPPLLCNCCTGLLVKLENFNVSYMATWLHGYMATFATWDFGFGFMGFMITNAFTEKPSA